MMTHEQLEAIRKRLSLATKGDWYTEVNTIDNGSGVILTDINVQPGIALDVMSEADAEFIANAREDIPALLAEVERLRKALEYYADKGNYIIDEKYRDYYNADIEDDGGKKARNALGGDA